MFGAGIGWFMHFSSVSASVTRCALPITRNIAQLSKAKNHALISTFLPIEATQRAAQKLFKLVGRHEPCASAEILISDMKYIDS